LAPEKNFEIEIMKYSIYLKFEEVKIKNPIVIINIIEAFKFLLPCVSKFLTTIALIFLSLLKMKSIISNIQTSSIGIKI